MSFVFVIQAAALHQHHLPTGLTSLGHHRVPLLFLKCGHLLPIQQDFRLLRIPEIILRPMFFNGAGTTLVPLQQLHSSRRLAIIPMLHQVLVHNQEHKVDRRLSTVNLRIHRQRRISRSTLMAMGLHRLRRLVVLALIPARLQGPLVVCRQLVLHGYRHGRVRKGIQCVCPAL